METLFIIVKLIDRPMTIFTLRLQETISLIVNLLFFNVFFRNFQYFFSFVKLLKNNNKMIRNDVYLYECEYIMIILLMK